MFTAALDSEAASELLAANGFEADVLRLADELGSCKRGRLLVVSQDQGFYFVRMA